MNTDLHFSSNRQDWETPRDLFIKLNDEFAFTLDAAASDLNALCEQWYTEADDGLTQPWTGTVWCNPPYEDLPTWVDKAIRSAVRGATVVMLVPARTDSRWWHGLMKAAAEVRFLDRRLHFGGSSTPAPFPASVVVLRPDRLRWATDNPSQTFVMTGYRKKGAPIGWQSMTTTGVEG